MNAERFGDENSACRSHLLVLVGLLCFGGALAPPAMAATITMLPFDNAFCFSGHNWSVVQCWDLGRAPITGDDVVMNGVAGSAAPVSNYDLSASVQLHSVTILNGGGSVQIDGGPIVLQSGGFITNSNSNNGTDKINAGLALSGPMIFTRSSGNQQLDFNGAITGTGPLSLANNGSQDLVLAAADSYSGSTTISGSNRVVASVNGAIPTGSALTVNGSMLFNTASTIGSLAGGGNVFMNGSNALTVGGDNTSTTFSGVYQNSGGSAALTKAGTGTLTLSGANTYTGATTVNAGPSP